MKDLQWFPPIPEPRAATAPPVIGSLIVAVAFGGLLLARGHRYLAIVVWVAASVLALSFASSALRKQIFQAAHWFGTGVGYLMTRAVLWPFYVVVFGSIRLALTLARIDLLGLRIQGEQPSYWQPAVPERKRTKYYDRLFTVEPERRESHFFALSIGILTFVLFLAGSSEMLLRTMGFGDPIVYRVDPRVGYYPAPHQNIHRYGGEIHINAFGMRSREVTAEKPTGTFRILMLGDSTLYGGSYVDQSQMYATRLEVLLNQEPRRLPNSPRQVEVLGMGVNGWGPQHELAYVEEFGLFHADLIMVMGPPDDAYRPRYGIAQMPFFVEGHRPHLAWQEFGEHLLWEYNLRLTGQGEHGEFGLRAREVLADGVAAWLGIVSLAQAQGARVDFELLPSEEEARNGLANDSTQRVLDTLLPELARRQVPGAYPLTFFRSNLGLARLYHDGAHLDASGHKVYAVYLRDRVWQLASAE